MHEWKKACLLFLSKQAKMMYCRLFIAQSKGPLYFVCLYFPFCYLGSTISLIAVRSSPSILISVKAGMQIKSTPLGATNPRAIATALTAWFNAPAPIAWISAPPLSRRTPASAPATELGLDFAETFNISIPSSSLFIPSCMPSGYMPRAHQVYHSIATIFRG